VIVRDANANSSQLDEHLRRVVVQTFSARSGSTTATESLEFLVSEPTGVGSQMHIHS